MKVNISSLKCIPINTKHSFYSSATLSQVILELDIYLVFVQEPYTTTSRRAISIPNIPDGYTVFHALTSRITLRHAINHLIGVEIDLESNNRQHVFSVLETYKSVLC